MHAGSGSRGDDPLATSPSDAIVSGAISPGQHQDLDRALRVAEEQCGLAFSLYLGPWEGGRAGAVDLHARLTDPDRSVLIAVDAAGRQLQIVTGRQARIALDDRCCSLAAMSMTSSFAAGDLVGGIRDGLAVLGEHGRRQRTAWRDQP